MDVLSGALKHINYFDTLKLIKANTQMIFTDECMPMHTRH